MAAISEGIGVGPIDRNDFGIDGHVTLHPTNDPASNIAKIVTRSLGMELSFMAMTDFTFPV